MSRTVTAVSPTVLDRIAAASLRRMDARTARPCSPADAVVALVDLHVYAASAVAAGTVSYLRGRHRRRAGN